MLKPSVVPLLAGLLLASAARGDYSTSDSPGLKWSDDTASVTPESNALFHGDFGTKPVTVTLDKIPPHDFLQFSAQLLILRSWDGAYHDSGKGRIGPDYFRMSLDDGDASAQRTLIFATFSNTPVMSGFDREKNFQTYPFPLPGDRCPYMTGTDFKNNFGYLYPLGGNQPPFPLHMDSVYTIKMTLPHTADKAVLNFRGVGLQGVPDESWGLMNVHILPRSKEQLPSPIGQQPYEDIYFNPDGTQLKLPAAPSLAQVVKAALGKEAVAANDAFWQLVASSEVTVDYLQANTKPRDVDVAKVKEMVDALYEGDAPADEKDPRVQAILKLGIVAEPCLRNLRQEKNETPSRLDWVFMEQGIIPVEDGGMREWLLATRLLEAIGTPAAKKARATLIGGKPELP